MIKKIYSIILLLVFTVSMVGCETNSPFVSKRVSSKSEMQEETQSENDIESTVQSNDSSTEASEGIDNQSTNKDNDEDDEFKELDKELEAIANIETNIGIFDVELTLPKDYVGEITQEELDEQAKNRKFNSAKLNADGSVTYKMSKDQHQQMLDLVVEEINASLDKMVGSEDYPSFTKIEHNDNYTSFTVTTTSEELGLYDSFSLMELYTLGGMYGIYSGDRVDNVHVEYVNESSGRVIDSADSKNLATDENTD